MIPALSQIWEACFGDSPEYIRFFMEKRFPSCRCFVWLEGNEPVGAIYLLPCYLKEQPVLYAYAGGVLPQYRKQGCFSDLINCSAQVCQEEGASLILVPAPGTEEYYQKRGFQTAFSYVQFELEGTGKLVSADFRDVHAEEYTRMRDLAFSRYPHLQWGVEAVQYALAENRFCGGFSEIMTLEQEYLLFGRQDGDTVELMETTMDLDTAKRTASALCRRWGAKRVRVRLPADHLKCGIPSGSVLGQTNFSSGWLGLNLL